MKTFYWILGNATLASITNFTVWFAIIFFVFLETRSVFATSMLSGIYLVAVALSGFWFGSIVDHNKKKWAMLLSSSISLIFYVISFAVYLGAPTESFKDPANPILWFMSVLLLFGVIAGNIRNIAIPTLVTIMVPEEDRDKANGLTGTAMGISFLITSVISGFLVGWGGMYYVFIFGIAMTILSILHLFAVTVPEKEIVHLPGQKKEVDIRGTIAAIATVSGLFALILFTTFNNFLGGVFMSLMDAYGLSMVSVQTWGMLWGFLSLGFILWGLIISKWGLGKNPLRSLFLANIIIWAVCIFFTIQPSILLLAIGSLIYITVVPFIEASEHTIIQKVVPVDRQWRVFGFAQSVEMAASPLTAFMIGPIAQFIFIPFMTTGAWVDSIGVWFGTGPARGIALVFTITGIIGLLVTIIAMRSKSYRLLSRVYSKEEAIE